MCHFPFISWGTTHASCSTPNHPGVQDWYFGILYWHVQGISADTRHLQNSTKGSSLCLSFSKNLGTWQGDQVWTWSSILHILSLAWKPETSVFVLPTASWDGVSFLGTGERPKTHFRKKRMAVRQQLLPTDGLSYSHNGLLQRCDETDWVTTSEDAIMNLIRDHRLKKESLPLPGFGDVWKQAPILRFYELKAMAVWSEPSCHWSQQKGSHKLQQDLNWASTDLVTGCMRWWVE